MSILQTIISKFAQRTIKSLNSKPLNTVVEKRKGKRYQDGSTSYLFTVIGRCMKIKIVDISIRGVRISTSSELPKNMRGELLLSYHGTTMYIPLRLSWKKEIDKKSEYGAYFTKIHPNSISLIKKYITLSQQRAVA